MYSARIARRCCSPEISIRSVHSARAVGQARAEPPGRDVWRTDHGGYRRSGTPLAIAGPAGVTKAASTPFSDATGPAPSRRPGSTLESRAAPRGRHCGRRVCGRSMPGPREAHPVGATDCKVAGSAPCRDPGGGRAGAGPAGPPSHPKTHERNQLRLLGRALAACSSGQAKTPPTYAFLSLDNYILSSTSESPAHVPAVSFTRAVHDKAIKEGFHRVNNTGRTGQPGNSSRKLHLAERLRGRPVGSRFGHAGPGLHVGGRTEAHAQLVQFLTRGHTGRFEGTSDLVSMSWSHG
jgi:hypothetical protein